MGRLVGVVAIALAACSEPARPRLLTPAPPATASVDAAAVAVADPVPAAVTTKYTVLFQGNAVIGSFEFTTSGDTFSTRGKWLNNGRGDTIETTYRIGPDGSVLSYKATGTAEFGSPIAETFTRTGTSATWSGEGESGQREVQGPAVWLPNAWSPETGVLILRAARGTGRVALLPTGEARVEKVDEQTVTVNGTSKHLTLYLMLGPILFPGYVWLEDDGTLFGNLRKERSGIREGWESTNEMLVARQEAIEQARLTAIAKKTAHRPPEAGLAYIHARVLDVVKGKWLVDHAVVVVGDKITAVGPTKTIKLPANAEVVDLAGKALVPGFVDMHSHTNEIGGLLNIASGVTTVRMPGGDFEVVNEMKGRFDSGALVGPQTVLFGFIEGRGPKAIQAKVTAMNADEAKAAVEKYAAAKYHGIKVYNSVPPEIVPVITKAAHAKGMQVIGHIPMGMIAEDAVNAGFDGVEHMNQVMLNFVGTRETDTRDLTRFTLVSENALNIDLKSKRVLDFFALLRKHKVIVDPTFGVVQNKMLPNEPGKPPADLVRLLARIPTQTARFYLRNGLPATGEKIEVYRASWKRMLEMAKAMHDAKIHVVLGTDAPIQGLMLHHEMELFAQAGFSNASILELASLGAARAMKLDKTFGSITKGKRADLVVIDGDPLAKLEDIEKVISTMRAGVVYPSGPLYEAVGVVP